jgi:biopolymer transport protein ExbB
MLTNVFLHVALLGAEWVMWLLIGISFLSIALIIERALYFRSRRLTMDLNGDLQDLMQRGMYRDAMQLVADSRAPECQVIHAGLQQLMRGPQAMSEAMLSAKADVRPEMERSLGILGTIGNNAPFVGLLGTVLGVIKASADMQASPASESAANAAMSGVFEALVATAVGLFVAIPAVVAFNYFQRTVKTKLTQIDSAAHLVLALVRPAGAAPTQSSAPSPGLPPMPPPPPSPTSSRAR